MGMRSALLAVTASVALLGGCASAAPLPEPMSQAEAQQRIDESNRLRWDAMFPGELMPTVEPVAYLEPGASWTEITDCLRDAAVEGVSFNTDDSWSRAVAGSAELEHAVDVARFVCQLTYPLDLSDPAKLGFRTDEQLEWIWNYNQKRLVPCLLQLGYRTVPQPEEYVKGSNSWWMPYYEMSPVPASDAEWARIDLRCPPPPLWSPEPRPTMD